MQSVHGAIAGAAVWPLTLVMQLWYLRRQTDVGPTTMTFGAIRSHYPAGEQARQQWETVVVACNAVLSSLPAYTNEFVLADALFYVGARQALAQSRKLDFSDDMCREHVMEALSSAFDGAVAAFDGEEERP